MATGRLIKKNIFISKKINSLSSPLVENIYIRLIVNTDDFGRGQGDPETVKGCIYPLKNNNFVKKIEEALKELHEKNLIYYYRVEGEYYYQIIKFDEFQSGLLNKRTHSIFPEYPEEINSIHETSENFQEIPENSVPTKLNLTKLNLIKPNENSDKGSKEPVNKSKKPKLSGKEAYNFATGVKKEKEYIDTIKKPLLLERMAKECYKTWFDYGEPCKKQDKPECKVCLPLQAEMKLELNKQNDVPQTYAQCENFILKNCYVKDHGTKPKYDFCYKCAKDDIWGINKGKW